MMVFFLGLNISLLIISAGLGYIESKRLLSRYPDLELETLHHKARYIFFIILIIPFALAIILLPMNSKTLLWSAPLWFDLYGIPLIFGILIGSFSFLFTLVSLIARRVQHKEKNGIVFASVLLVGAFPLFQYQYTHPVYPLVKESRPSGMILQSHSSSCAAASGANIARVLGLTMDEKKMAELMNTSVMGGTNPGQIIRGLEQAGVSCTKKWKQDADAGKFNVPAMFFIDNEILGPESHAVAFVGFRGSDLEIWDPLEGKVLYPPEKFRKIWHGKGVECSLTG